MLIAETTFEHPHPLNTFIKELTEDIPAKTLSDHGGPSEPTHRGITEGAVAVTRASITKYATSLYALEQEEKAKLLEATYGAFLLEEDPDSPVLRTEVTERGIVLTDGAMSTLTTPYLRLSGAHLGRCFRNTRVAFAPDNVGRVFDGITVGVLGVHRDVDYVFTGHPVPTEGYTIGGLVDLLRTLSYDGASRGHRVHDHRGLPRTALALHGLIQAVRRGEVKKEFLDYAFSGEDMGRHSTASRMIRETPGVPDVSNDDFDLIKQRLKPFRTSGALGVDVNANGDLVTRSNTLTGFIRDITPLFVPADGSPAPRVTFIYPAGSELGPVRALAQAIPGSLVFEKGYWGGGALSAFPPGTPADQPPTDTPLLSRVQGSDRALILATPDGNKHPLVLPVAPDSDGYTGY